MFDMTTQGLICRLYQNYGTFPIQAYFILNVICNDLGSLTKITECKQILRPQLHHVTATAVID